MALYLLYTNRGIFQSFAATAAKAREEAKEVLGSKITITKTEFISSRTVYGEMAGVILPKEGVQMGCARLTGQNVAERKAELSFANFVMDDAAREAEISHAMFTIPDVPGVDVDRIAQLSFVDLSIPNPAQRAAMSWAQMSIPDAPFTGATLRPTYIAGNDSANKTALQNAINTAKPGDQILLPEGSKWVGWWTLPQKADVDKYITIKTEYTASSAPPVGVRVTSSYYAKMAKIGLGAGATDTITTNVASSPAVKYWKFECLEILPPDIRTSGQTRANVSLGHNDTQQITLDVIPHHISFDRCWIHGDPFRGGHRGFYINSGLTEIYQCVVDGFRTTSPDGQVINGINGSGPLYITDCELGGGTETYMHGGDSTKVPNMIMTDVQIKKCWIHNYVELRNADAVPPMPTVTASVVAGTLPAGTHTFRVSPRATVAGSSTNGAQGTNSPDINVTLGAPGGVTLSWTALNPTSLTPADISYRVWKKNSDGTWKYFNTAILANSYTYTAEAAGTTGSTPPTNGVGWAIKNIVETKSGVNVLFDGCLLENMWVSGQTGQAFAMKLNDYRSCTECKSRSENITIQNCVARHICQPGIFVAAEGPGTTLGDSSYILTNVKWKNVLFYDSNDSWGSSGYYQMTIGPSTRTNFKSGVNGLEIDHCTFIHYDLSGGVERPGGIGITKFYDFHSTTGLYDKLGPLPFKFTNNLLMKGKYGFFGINVQEGNDALTKYCTAYTVARNVFAGAVAKSYPSDNDFPTQAAFEAEFKKYTARDPNDTSNYVLKSTSKYATTYLGTDNKPIGVDIAAIRAAFSNSDLPKIANLV